MVSSTRIPNPSNPMIAFAFDPGLSKFRAIPHKIRKLLKLKVFLNLNEQDTYQ